MALLHTIIAVTALRDVLTKENEALELSKSQAFMELQDEKIEVARRYELLVNHLMSSPHKLKAADQKLKDQLQRLQGSFGEVTRKNVALLDRMSRATTNLKEYIMSAARKEADAQTQFSYGSMGKMQKGGKSTIGVDERA